MLTLTPKIYKKGMKHSLLSANKIDTVIAHPISNAAAENIVLHSEEINTVTLNGNTHTLPINQDIVATHFHSSSNRSRANFIIGYREFAKARIECVLVSGKTTCTVTQVVQGTPTVNIHLNGSSKVITRGGSKYANYPTSDTLSRDSYSIASWINENKTETKTALTHDCSGATFSMNPWVRNIVPFDSDIDPTFNDVITDWASGNSGRSFPWWDKWVENSNFDTSAFPEFRMRSPNTVLIPSDYDRYYGSSLVMQNMYLPIQKRITKIDDYNYEVNWTVPVRIAYAAASCEFGPAGGEYEVDNFAYLDEVSSIVIELSGTPFSTDVQDISYSLDASGNLSNVPKGTYPFEIDAGEALTLDTYQGTSNNKYFIDKDTVQRGYYLSVKEGREELVSNADSFITDYIFLPKNSTLFVLPNDKIPQYWQGCFYDVNRQLIGAVEAPGYDTTVDEMVFSIREDRYVRLNGKVEQLDAGSYYVRVRSRYLWSEKLSKELLNKYSIGKYTVECVVRAEWAIANKIAVNTKMQVQLLNGDFISRGSVPCTFTVKNIEKKYIQSEFTYSLKLLEV